jgi:hypothetical protein
LHGYGVLLRIGQISGAALRIEQGALYPALYRLERQKLLETEWGVSENNRRAKYYGSHFRGASVCAPKSEAGTGSLPRCRVP